MNLESILVFAVTALAAPVLGWVAHLFIDAAKVRKAHRRLETEPLVHEGARFRQLLSDGGAPLMGPGRIARLQRGRVLVVADDGREMTFTGQEFEAMHPQFDRGGDDPGADPPAVARSGRRMR